MRIAIDFQVAQAGPEARRRQATTQLLALLRALPDADVVVVLNSRLNEHIEELRCALAGQLAGERIRLFTPPDMHGAPAEALAWLAQAESQLRSGFLATLRPDLLVTLISNDMQDNAIALSAPAAASPWPEALLLLDPLALADAGEGADALHALVQRAACVLVDDGASAAAGAALGAAIRVTPLGEAAGALQAALSAHPVPVVSVPAARPRMAYISPLPPEKSGIADYSAELLPELTRFYDIEVIVDQPVVENAWINATLPIRQLDYFEQHASGYDILIYHFGNSAMHRHMFSLLERHPGIVVLHDFYLANLLHYMHHSGYRVDALQQALYYAHGFGAVLDSDQIGESAAVWKYPCNKSVLDNANGIIVHSAYPKKLAERWYGPGAADEWRTLPLLRGLPVDGRADARAKARASLGLSDDQFLVCTFGMLGPTKLNHRLLDGWLASTLAADKRCKLVFVGELAGGNYGHNLLAQIAGSRRRKQISITGFVTQALYRTYLAACDIAVQLRSDSRGETSASVLDCLLFGVPTIVNAHGATAELPADVLLMLEDDVSVDSLAAGLSALRADPAECARLQRAGSNYIAQHHSPARVGEAYHEAIRHFERDGRRQQYRSVVQALLAQPGSASMPQDALLRCASALAANQPALAPRQLLVDVSAMVQTDLKTGIQRVVRSILNALMAAPPAGYRIEPVYSRGNMEPYRYARGYMQHALVVPVHDLDDAPIEVNPGDIFLGLDLMMHGVHQNRALLQRYRDRGMQIHFVVYDVLPLLLPHHFPFGAEANFADWIDTIATVSDGLVCISRSVADELAGWLARHPPARQRPLQLGYFHLGADIGASAPTHGMPDGADLILQRVSTRPSLLMVGTVEPRKGHALALAACEALWAAGTEVNLIIVGKHGWMVDALADRMNGHAERDKRLFWLQGVSDEMLLKLYRGSSALLAASEGEGFGLPLIEAAQHGLPLIARDLPVFREVSGEHAFYFQGDDAASLAASLTEWLTLLDANQAPSSQGMPWLTWRESADQLLDNLIGQHWYRSERYPQ
ncbi:MAG TPA: glycosyltransferase [Telluria sp.]|jgi:glycosyltransferase involved in cell wall biosynthesis